MSWGINKYKKKWKISKKLTDTRSSITLIQYESWIAGTMNLTFGFVFKLNHFTDMITSTTIWSTFSCYIFRNSFWYWWNFIGFFWFFFPSRLSTTIFFTTRYFTYIFISIASFIFITCCILIIFFVVIVFTIIIWKWKKMFNFL